MRVASAFDVASADPLGEPGEPACIIAVEERKKLQNPWEDW